MGFETSISIFDPDHHRDYETSLWDLKRTSKVSISKVSTYYETSLWDLKQAKDTLPPNDTEL